MVFGAINDAHSEQYFKISLTIGRERREERTIEPAQKKARLFWRFRVLRVSQKLLNENWLRQFFFLAINFVYQELNTYQFESKIAYGCSEKVQQRNNIEWNPVSFCPLHLATKFCCQYMNLKLIFQNILFVASFENRASSLFTSTKCWFLGFIWCVIFKN